MEIITERLLLRPARPSDGDAFVARRSDPEVARFQAWETPFSRERAAQMLDRASEMSGPRDDAWYMLTIVETSRREIVGDLALRMRWQGRMAEVGYTLGSEYWGNGYATEALTALVRRFFDDGSLTRVFAMLDPNNVASARVLERTGFRFEGWTRRSFWLNDRNEDDWIYGLTRPDWDTWRNRPSTEPDEVTLVPIDADNQRAVSDLETHKTQESFVAPVGRSYANALFPPTVEGTAVEPWLRAVNADGRLVGFVMLALPNATSPDPFLWRMLIDRLHQRRGIGRRVLDLLVEDRRSAGDRALTVSWERGVGSPEPFYLGYGFEATGRLREDEIEGRLVL